MTFNKEAKLRGRICVGVKKSRDCSSNNEVGAFKKSRRAVSHYLRPLSLLMEDLSMFASSGNRKCSR